MKSYTMSEHLCIQNFIILVMLNLFVSRREVPLSDIHTGGGADNVVSVLCG